MDNTLPKLSLIKTAEFKLNSITTIQRVFYLACHIHSRNPSLHATLYDPRLSDAHITSYHTAISSNGFIVNYLYAILLYDFPLSKYISFKPINLLSIHQRLLRCPNFLQLYQIGLSLIPILQ